ncbi:2Fe-2S iron-sulfur cluster binding domain-containing protein [Streptomyces sp. S3(2020)]|nr:2Fe-2S iron-sulfur cluster binding domain-containing protein [Streptomyces sp. S3(2020)]NNN30430.1 2Fe-2S iron-sulfur cluster binding domain-containing protein [Streptomyces sp. S3(2020)]
MCGACLTPVLSGEPDHRDEVQADEERAANTQITICCSRSRSAELVLGL